MAKALSEDQRAAYGRDGFVHPVAVRSGGEAREMRTRLEAFEAGYGPLHYVSKAHLISTAVAELASDARVLDAVEDLIGADILLHDAACVIKEPHSAGFVSWHQDLTYWGLSSADLVTVWLALSPATPESGCMRALPGSHKRGRRNHNDTYGADNILHRGQRLSEAIDEGAARAIVLAPGEASLHHGWVAHASGPNRSDDRRIGLTAIYAAASMRSIVTGEDSARLMRGHDRFGHFRPEPWPCADLEPALVAFRDRAEAVRHRIYDTD